MTWFVVLDKLNNVQIVIPIQNLISLLMILIIYHIYTPVTPRSISTEIWKCLFVRIALTRVFVQILVQGKRFTCDQLLVNEEANIELWENKINTYNVGHLFLQRITIILTIVDLFINWVDPLKRISCLCTAVCRGGGVSVFKINKHLLFSTTRPDLLASSTTHYWIYWNGPLWRFHG